MYYRVTMVVVHLGWVDSDLGSSSAGGPFCRYLLSNRQVEHPKCKSTQPRCVTYMVTMYRAALKGSSKVV